MPPRLPPQDCSGGIVGLLGQVETSKGVPSVSAENLQQSLTEQLTKAGNAPKSVHCKTDLAGSRPDGHV